jgi:pyruvate decarboxylase
MSNQTVPLGQYIFRRVKELGVEHIVGVPGDFNRMLHLLNAPLYLWQNNNLIKHMQ